MTKNEQLAWAAGFFDGEGTVGSYSIRPNQKTHKLLLSIAQNDRRVLDRFQQIVGLGSVRGPYKGKGNSNPYYSFQIYAADHVKEVINLLWPWLGEVKKDQFRTALTLYNSKQSLKTPEITISAFGETKSISSWVKDPRCSVSYKSLYSRVSREWTPEKAITSPPLNRCVPLPQEDD